MPTKIWLQRIFVVSANIFGVENNPPPKKNEQNGGSTLKNLDLDLRTFGGWNWCMEYLRYLHWPIKHPLSWIWEPSMLPKKIQKYFTSFLVEWWWFPWYEEKNWKRTNPRNQSTNISGTYNGGTHLQKLYGYGLRKRTPTPKIALQGSRNLSNLGGEIISKEQTKQTTLWHNFWGAFGNCFL